MNGAHTINFGAPEELVRANKKGANPAGGPGMPKGADPPIRDDGGAYDGAGIRSSGLLVGSGDTTCKLRFPKAGTSEYRYLVQHRHGGLG